MLYTRIPRLTEKDIFDIVFRDWAYIPPRTWYNSPPDLPRNRLTMYLSTYGDNDGRFFGLVGDDRLGDAIATWCLLMGEEFPKAFPGEDLEDSYRHVELGLFLPKLNPRKIVFLDGADAEAEAVDGDSAAPEAAE